jgi:hypothetical protein
MRPAQSREHERRRYGRIQLDDEPLPAVLDEAAVQVIEVSVVGCRISHDTRFSPTTNSRTIRVTWNDRKMEFWCEIVRSTLFKIGRGAGDKSIYHSGIRFIEASGDSEATLRDLIAARIIRALEEQKANARGIPPLDQYTYRVGKSNRYLRCEFTGDRWRNMETTRVEQPENGFTISADIDPAQIEILCRTYERADPHGRRLTQILAELSIRKEEGTKVRRYTP